MTKINTIEIELEREREIGDFLESNFNEDEIIALGVS
jgi:hypothetical protein